MKPFDTFAREMLQLIWGREDYNGKSPVDVVFSWIVLPMSEDDPWNNSEMILIRHSGLREALGLPNDKLYYKPRDF